MNRRVHRILKVHGLDMAAAELAKELDACESAHEELTKEVQELSELLCCERSDATALRAKLDGVRGKLGPLMATVLDPAMPPVLGAKLNEALKEVEGCL